MREQRSLHCFRKEISYSFIQEINRVRRWLPLRCLPLRFRTLRLQRPLTVPTSGKSSPYSQARSYMGSRHRSFHLWAKPLSPQSKVNLLPSIIFAVGGLGRTVHLLHSQIRENVLPEKITAVMLTEHGSSAITPCDNDLLYLVVPLFQGCDQVLCRGNEAEVLQS